MDFTLRKPAHILAVILLAFSLIVFIILPIFSYFTPPATNGIQFSGIAQIIFEVFFVTISLLLVFFFMIIVPFLWYVLVNGLQLREILQRIHLRFETMDKVIFFGVVTAGGALILSLGISVAIQYIFSAFGREFTDASNIPILESLLSPFGIILLVTIQPIAEEIFFRGFLLEKINGLAGEKIALLSTSVLFGVAHLSYGMVYTLFMATILGFVFGYVLIKTKNLYVCIITHILLNVFNITVYFLGKSLGL